MKNNQTKKYTLPTLVLAALLVLSLSSCDLFNGFLDPETPTEVAITEIGSDYLVLSWIDNSTNELGFQVQKKEAGGSWQAAGTVSADAGTFTVDGLSSSTRYALRIRAFNDAGNSEYGTEVQTDTLAAAGSLLPTVTVTSPADGATVSNPVTISFTVSDWEREGAGTTHLHPFVDGKQLGAIMALAPFDLSAMYTAGTGGQTLGGFHRVELRLANQDHTFTGVFTVVEITVP